MPEAGSTGLNFHLIFVPRMSFPFIQKALKISESQVPDSGGQFGSPDTGVRTDGWMFWATKATQEPRPVTLGSGQNYP